MPVTRVLVPVGMLGGGFSPQTVTRGIELGADVIAVDGGSTDSGPYYLGAAQPKTTEAAVARDLHVLLAAGQAAHIPLVVGSCGTGGTDRGVDWIAGIVHQLAADTGLRPRVARLYSEQRADAMIQKLRAGRVASLEPAGPLDDDTLLRCTHIVGLMGHEPIAATLQQGADVVLAGRATDTALIAALPLLRGCPPGPTWHAAKTAECGGLCTTNPRTGGVLVTIDETGFTIEPLDPASACTTRSVAAHMLYENADPFRMREPSGTLDTAGARYTQLDGRRVRVEGSRFEPASPTMKLEGAAVAGYQTVAISGIRDPDVLADVRAWRSALAAFLADGVHRLLGYESDEYHLELRTYGFDAVLGDLEPDTTPPREVGVVLLVTAGDQQQATTIAKYANPYLLHWPTADMDHLPSFAFLSSPAELERGPIYEFVLQHAVSLDTPLELVRVEVDDT
jgi:hypothetical protein